jgi:hypothetical protein
MKISYQKIIIAGAIAGFVDGIVSFLSAYSGAILNLFYLPPEVLTLPFIPLMLGSIIPYNIMWGIVFGLAFAMTYDRIPGKGATKGLIFALIFYWLLSNIRNSQIMATGGEIRWPIIQVWVGFFASIAYGLVLGYLYKPKK